MSVPTAPTITNLVTEAWNKAGVDSPTSAQLTRASTYFLEEVLDDIWSTSVITGNSRLKSLQDVLVANTTVGVRTYDMAEAFDSELTATILDGSYRGTAQAGGATSITLAVAETVTDDIAVGKYILITGGTGIGGYRQITAYNETTKVATVDSAWTINPAVSSTYLIVTKEYLLDEIGTEEMRDYQPLPSGRPTEFAVIGRQIIFNRPFDLSTYGLRIDYFVNIHQVDRVEGAGTRITRLLTNWRTTLMLGLTWKVLEFLDDNRQDKKLQEYREARAATLVKEIPYTGAWSGFSC